VGDFIKWTHYTDGSDDVSVEPSQAYKEGFVAYGRHYIDDNPYEEDTEEHDDWRHGYDDAAIKEVLEGPSS